MSLDREDATKESDFAFDDEEDEGDVENDWDGEIEWTDQDEVEAAPDGDVPDESAAYLEFLNQEASPRPRCSIRYSSDGWGQAQKFGSFADDDDDGMDEESLLETPLDKIEPYGLFKHVFIGKCSDGCSIRSAG